MNRVHLLLELLETNLDARVETFGFRNEYQTTVYTPRDKLRMFMDEVLPLWTQHTDGEDVHYADTEQAASRCLSMLQTALVVDQIIQAYGMNTRDVLSTKAFADSPVVVEMLKNLWYFDLENEQLVRMKRTKVFVDLITQECPNFYELYDRKKVEYNMLVYKLDVRTLDTWSHSCQCLVPEGQSLE